MTKKKLLELLDKCRLPNEACRTYATEIKALLRSFPDDENIGVSTIDEFGSRGVYFESKLEPRDVEIELSELLGAVKTWVDSYKNKQGGNVSMEGKKKHGMIVFISIVAVMIVATAVLVTLDILGKFKYGNELSIALDGVGLITGLAFFVYERVTDNKEKDNINGGEKKSKMKKVKKVSKNVNKNGAQANAPHSTANNTVVNNYYSTPQEEKPHGDTQSTTVNITVHGDNARVAGRDYHSDGK